MRLIGVPGRVRAQAVGLGVAADLGAAAAQPRRRRRGLGEHEHRLGRAADGEAREQAEVVEQAQRRRAEHVRARPIDHDAIYGSRR